MSTFASPNYDQQNSSSDYYRSPEFDHQPETEYYALFKMLHQNSHHLPTNPPWPEARFTCLAFCQLTHKLTQWDNHNRSRTGEEYFFTNYYRVSTIAPEIFWSIYDEQETNKVLSRTNHLKRHLLGFNLNPNPQGFCPASGFRKTCLLSCPETQTDLETLLSPTTPPMLPWTSDTNRRNSQTSLSSGTESSESCCTGSDNVSPSPQEVKPLDRSVTRRRRRTFSGASNDEQERYKEPQSRPRFKKQKTINL